jgi:hypothetical protein
MEMSGQFYAPAASPQRKNPAPFKQEGGWAPDLVWMFWRTEKSRHYWDLDPKSSSLQPSHYGDYNIVAP